MKLKRDLLPLAAVAALLCVLPSLAQGSATAPEAEPLDFTSVDIIKSPVIMKGIYGVKKEYPPAPTPDRKLFGTEVELPAAYHSPLPGKTNAKTAVVDVNAAGQLSMDGKHKPRREFFNELRARYKREGEFPVLIRGDRRATHRQIRAVTDICTSAGLWRLRFAAQTLKKTGEKVAAYKEFSRPAPDPNAKPGEKIEDLVSIIVFKGKGDEQPGYVVNRKRMKAQDISNLLDKLSSSSKTMSVIIKCTADSKHGDLVTLLDLCEKAGLRNVSVFSL